MVDQTTVIASYERRRQTWPLQYVDIMCLYIWW